MKPHRMSNHLSISRAFLWLNLPEWNVAIFSFLLNFVWEIQQMPFFQIPSDFPCSDIIRIVLLQL